MEQITIDIIKAVGVIIVALVTGVIGTALKLSKTDVVSQKQLSEEKDSIYNEMDDKIEKATKELATKESVAHLSAGFEKLEKKFEKKMDDFTNVIHEMMIKVEVMAERRKEPRG